MQYGIFLLSFLFLIAARSEAQDLRINEAVSANYALTDEDGDSPDWFEIYNPGSTPVNLANWSITDDPETEEAWTFPNMNLAAGGYLRVWASKKDRKGNAGHLHTDFKISAAGETLYLRRADGSTAHILTLPPNLEYYGYGLPSGSNQPAVLSETTPAAANPAQGWLGVNLSDIEFSQPGGVSAPFLLKLTTEVPNSYIRYTLDATEPTENAAAFPSEGLPITEKTVIRARVFRDGYLPSRTQSRFFLVNISHTLPVVSLITEPDNFFDEETGIYVYGNEHSDDLPYFGANFWEDWERPLHFSFYEPTGQGSTEFDCGTKIFGGWSRANDQRSLSLFARSRYGTEEFNYPFFDKRAFSDFQSLVLRNAGNDWQRANMRDIFMTSLAEDTDLEIQAYRPVAAYLNGEYWGMYNLREKISKHFVASRYGVDADEVTLLEFNGSVIDGNNADYYNLINFLQANALQNPVAYEYVTDRVDTENYITYQVMQIYFANTDWPGNNVKYWKTPGGKWRWILFDTDFGLGSWGSEGADHNTLAFALEPDGPNWPNPAWATFLFRKMNENQSFRHTFINRFADEMNSRFLAENTLAHLDSLRTVLLPELTKHYDRWDTDLGMHYWQVEVIEDFLKNRNTAVKGHIKAQYDLPAYHELKIDNATPERGKAVINDRLHIREESWRGDYFETVPISVEAVVTGTDEVFSHWEGDTLSIEPVLVFDLKKDFRLIPVFEPRRRAESGIIINEINYQSAAEHDAGDWIELHNTNDFTADLSAYVLSENATTGGYTLPEGTLIEAGGYLIIAENVEKFRSVYSDVSPVAGDFAFDLPDSDGTVLFLSHLADTVSVVRYESRRPWPLSAAGQGGTLELLRPDLDTEKAINWKSVHPFGSPGATNIPDILPYYGQILTDFSVSPNPFESLLDIRFALTLPGEVRVDLYDSRGALLKNMLQENLPAGHYYLSPTLENLPQGMYWLRAEAAGEEPMVLKLVKG